MKINRLMIGVILGLSVVSSLQAKPKKAKPTWEQKKAKFKDPAGEAAKKINDALPKELSAKPIMEVAASDDFRSLTMTATAARWSASRACFRPRAKPIASAVMRLKSIFPLPECRYRQMVLQRG